MDPKKNNKKPNEDMSILTLLIFGLILTFFINMGVSRLSSSQAQEISFDSFIYLLENDMAEKVVVSEDRYQIVLKEGVALDKIKDRIYDDLEEEPSPIADGAIFGLNPVAGKLFDLEEEKAAKYTSGRTFYTGSVYYPDLAEMIISKGVTLSRPVTQNSFISDIIVNWVIPLAIIYFMFSLIMRSMSKRMGGSGGFMNVGKSSAKMYNLEKKTGVTFDDVAGQEEAKDSLNEIVDFLHHPEKYTAIGAKQPKGALLVGPPGTGKTLLARAVAGEAKAPFFSLSGSEFVEMYVGVGASRVRDLFKIANQHAPCIIFIDEIDAIGKSRDNQINSNDEREQTLNQLLSEMDGFDISKGIVILAATNRPEILDKALLRPGRFDRRIIVEKPDLIGREAILMVHSRKVKLDDDVSIKQIAQATSGAAGADLANMINEAALRAVRLGRGKVKQEDLMEAVEVVIAGKEKKDRILSKKEKRLVAFHEVGHALTAALQKNTQPVQKITIVPRTMGALGYVMQVPEEDRYLMTKEELLAEITVLLGGRAAEKVIFNTQTTGASNDIERATAMARSMVAQYGMSGAFGVMGLERIQDRYLDGRAVLTCSEETGAKRDLEVKTILEGCFEKAVAILSDNKDIINDIAEFLIEKESISGEDFMKILKEHKPDFEEIKKEESKL